MISAIVHWLSFWAVVPGLGTEFSLAQWLALTILFHVQWGFPFVIPMRRQIWQNNIGEPLVRGEPLEPFVYLAFLIMKRQKKTEIQPKKIIPLDSSSGEIPLELDFFKYAQGSYSKRKSPDSTTQEGKRRKLHHDDINASQVEEKKPATVHRVAAKGENIPAHVESFAALKTYSISSHLLSNLVSSGYTEPTSVQSYCIPILLEVIDLAFVLRLNSLSTESGSCGHLSDRYRENTGIPCPNIFKACHSCCVEFQNQDGCWCPSYDHRTYPRTRPSNTQWMLETSAGTQMESRSV